MKTWYVITPVFPYTEIIDEYGGPTYDICDVIEIEAETARDAIRFGVKEMLKGGWIGKWKHQRYSYCKDQQLDNLCPYTGVRAEEKIEDNR